MSKPLFPVLGGTGKSIEEEVVDDWLMNDSFQDNSAQHPHRTKRKHKSDKSKSTSRKKKHRSEKEKMYDSELKIRAKTGEKRRSEQQKTEIYHFDIRGDRDALLYESLYNMDTPSYVYGYGYHCIGLSPQITMSSSLSHVFTLARLGPSVKRSTTGQLTADVSRVASIDRFWSPVAVVRFRSRRLRRIDLSRRDWPEPKLEEFISVREYDGDFEGTSQSESFEEYLMRRTRDFSRKTNDHPDDVDVWLDYVDFQDQFLKLSKRSVSASVVEKKIAIYEKALAINTRSERLNAGYLAECAKIYDSDRVLKLWSKTMQRSPHNTNPRLWMEYLAYRQSIFGTFSVGSMRLVYSNAAATLHGQLDDARDKEGLEMVLLDIILRAIRFEVNAGYTERGIALIQALLEYNLFSIDNPSPRTFARFWDSCCPRIGDANAMGWCAWQKDVSERVRLTNQKLVERRQRHVHTVESDADFISLGDRIEQAGLDDKLRLIGGDESDDDASQPPLPRPPSPMQDDESLGKFVRFYAIETMRSRYFVTPFRKDVADIDAALAGCDNAEDTAVFLDGGFDHPVRSVDADDLLPFIFTATDVGEEMVFQCCQAIGAIDPIWAVTMRSTSDSLQHQYLTDDDSPRHMMDTLARLRTMRRGSVAGAGIGMCWDYDLVHVPLLAPIAFVRSLMDSLIGVCGDMVWLSVARVHFEVAIGDMDAARRAARSAMKRHRDSSSLVWEYAKAEYIAGHKEKAMTICEAALCVQPSCGSDRSLHLWLMTAELSLDHMNAYAISVALNILTTAVDGTYTPLEAPKHVMSPAPAASVPTVPPMRLLRAAKRYADMADTCGDGVEAFYTYAAWGLFEYCAHGLNAAEHILRRGEDVLGDCATERLLLFHCKLIYSHSSLHPCPPRTLRNVLMQAMDLFPNNRVILSMFIDNEAQSNVAGRVRREFDRLCSRDPTSVTWGAFISAEVQKHADMLVHADSAGVAVGGWGSPRIRSVFERAVASVRNSPALWRAYLHYEAYLACDAVRARRVFYRAAAQCPWSKGLWMDPFAHTVHCNAGDMPSEEVLQQSCIVESDAVWTETLGSGACKPILSHRDLLNLLELVQNKEVRMHTDVMELEFL